MCGCGWRLCVTDGGVVCDVMTVGRGGRRGMCVRCSGGKCCPGVCIAGVLRSRERRGRLLCVRLAAVRD